jgi:hypothetical protein
LYGSDAPVDYRCYYHTCTRPTLCCKYDNSTYNLREHLTHTTLCCKYDDSTYNLRWSGAPLDYRYYHHTYNIALVWCSPGL